MGIKLEKLELPTDAAIDAMAPIDLVVLTKHWRERMEVYQSLIFKVRRQLYGRRSERSESKDDNKDDKKDSATPAPRAETTKLPSQRYPDAPVHVDEIDFKVAQACLACGEEMRDSGMTETSEYLDQKPREFIVVEQRRHKHRCGKCHGSIVTAPLPPRITPGGTYSDEIIVDAALSKFCDLIPMGRYTKIAARAGFPGIPPHSLIQTSFRLAHFLTDVNELIKQEVLAEAVLMADETPHRMLEGDEKKRWYLWGFSTPKACFFECHDTRSGDVSTAVLSSSHCTVLVTDVYSGYVKSIRLTNELRKKAGKSPIEAAYCNAHARREFWAGDWDSPEMSLDQKVMIDHYKKIYKLNAESKGKLPEEILLKRLEMKSHFATMKIEAEQKKSGYSSKSQIGKAYNYFLKNYEGLTRFLLNAAVPIDNNASERLLRSHVVGRKTWYGTHSRKGAWVAATHFSIVETCKLNGVNPREYYLNAIDRIHFKQQLLTPSQYKESQSNSS